MVLNGFSVNRNVLPLIATMLEKAYELHVGVEKTAEGATIIDAGIEAQGGYAAGKYITEISMGGLGEASISVMPVGTTYLPTITVTTDSPSIALLGSQFAGWRVNVGEYFAMGSGPARALALKPRELYRQIGYQDRTESAIIILEASTKPTNDVLAYIAEECKVRVDKLYAIVVPTSSLAGSTQISGRIIETGLHKLTKVGVDARAVHSGTGYAPIAPIHPKPNRAMGRTNDMILYGGVSFFNVVYEDDVKLEQLVKLVPSSQSRDYGRPFADIFKDAGYDFYKIDSDLFAPAVIVVNNIMTGVSHRAGEINERVLLQSLSS